MEANLEIRALVANHQLPYRSCLDNHLANFNEIMHLRPLRWCHNEHFIFLVSSRLKITVFNYSLQGKHIVGLND